MICISIVHSQRNRTKPKDIAYGLYLYFLGLSYRNAAKALNRFVERSHVSIWKWVQHYKPQRVSYNRSKFSDFIIVNETQVKVGHHYFWIWIAIKSDGKKDHTW